MYVCITPAPVLLVPALKIALLNIMAVTIFPQQLQQYWQFNFEFASLNISYRTAISKWLSALYIAFFLEGLKNMFSSQLQLTSQISRRSRFLLQN